MNIEKDKQHFSMPVGASRVLKFEVDMAGDLQGARIEWWMARTAETASDKAFVKKNLLTGVFITGLKTFEVALVPDDTKTVPAGTWYHEAEVTDVDGNVDTVASGRVTLTAKLIK